MLFMSCNYKDRRCQGGYKMNFVTTDYFFTRIPLLPMDSPCILTSNTSEQLKFICVAFSDSRFAEAVHSSSPNLYKAIDKALKNPRPTDKDVAKIYYSIFKYYNRASTRTTPFGLFTAVGCGEFSKESCCLFDSDSCYTKRYRLDMQLLCGILIDIEKDAKMFDNLCYSVNESCVICGNRFMNPHISFNIKNPQNKLSQLSIRNTNAVKLVVSKMAQRYLPIVAIKEIVKTYYSDISEDTLNQFVNQLVENEIILPQLRPPLTNVDALAYIVNMMTKNALADPLREKLGKLQYCIRKLNARSLGDFLDCYEECVELVKQIYSGQGQLFQVDLKQVFLKNTLSSNVKIQIEDTITFLSQITIKNYNGRLYSYQQKFIEQYGHYKEIPVMDLLDSSIGLGSPFKNETQLGMTSEFVKRLNSLLLGKISQAQIGSPIILEKSELLKLGKTSERNDNLLFPCSLEIAFFIIATDKKTDNEDEYQLVFSPIRGSTEANKTMGRFSDLFYEDSPNPINEIQNKKMKFAEDHESILVEVHELPQANRLANLCQNFSNTSYHLSFGTCNPEGAKHIPLNDIYVGIDIALNRLYLKSRSLNRKIIVSNLNMISMKNYSDIFQFLVSVSEGEALSLFSFIEICSSIGGCYHPRIVFNKTILSPSRWLLTHEDFSEKDFDTFLNKFYEWKETWKIPQFVYMGGYDNRLHINLQSVEQLKKIHIQLLKNEKEQIELTEDLGISNGLWVKDTQGRKYCAEYIVPLLQEENIVAEKPKLDKPLDIDTLRTMSEIKSNEKRILINEPSRLLFPGDNNWWYYKLYVETDDIPKIISMVFDFCQTLKSDELIDKYFFIRYSDPNPHLRLRIHIFDNKKTAFFLNKMSSWLSSNKQDLLISASVIDVYRREYERYGGKVSYELVENFFSFDSLLAATAEKELGGNTNVFSKDMFAISIIIQTMHLCGLDITDQCSLLSSMFAPQDYRDSYKASRKQYLQAANISQCSTFYSEYNIGVALQDAINLRNQSLQYYWNAIKDQDKIFALTNSKKDILLSIIHMFCNRFGESTSWEKHIMHMARHSVYDLNNYYLSQRK